MADTDPVKNVSDDLKQKMQEARSGSFQLNGHTLFLMALIAIGAFAAYVLIIKPRQSSSTATGATTGSNPPVGTFISEPLSIVNEPPPATVVTGTPPPVMGDKPLPGNPGGTTSTPNARPTYQVHSGDTLSTIAAKEHVSVAALEKTPGNYSVIRQTEQSHGISTFTWDKIFPGESLYLPTSN